MRDHATYHALAAHVATTHASHGSGWLVYLLVVVLVVGVLAGRRWGRRAGLKHLGTSEFRNRWAAINRIRRW